MIRTVLYMEIEPRLLDDPMAMAVCERAAQLEAEAHGYTLGQRLVTHAEQGPNQVLVWDALPTQGA